jgi:hypothetical protein
MRKNKLNILVATLTFIILFSTAAICTQIGVQSEAPTIKLEIYDGPDYLESDNMCYYKLEATVTGIPDPEVEFVAGDNVKPLGSSRVEVGVDTGGSYSLTATATNSAGTATFSITLEGGCGEIAKAETSEAIVENETTSEEEAIDNAKLVTVFAITNESGDQLITFYSDTDEATLEYINGAIGEDGQFYEIEYIKKQDGNDQDNGRVISDNFKNMEGYVYGALGKKLVPNNTYYLCNSEVINKENLLTTVSSGIEVLDEETKIQIEDIEERSIQESWIIDKYSDGTQVLIVVFEPEGDNMLMSIVLKEDSDLKFIDYPATYDGYSAWRVDDGGKIDPELFSILFTTQTIEGLLIVMGWAGAEGENTFFLLEKAGTLSKLPLEIYRYWSAG